MHGSNLNYMYNQQYAAALMLQQNLAMAHLQQQQQQLALAAAAASANQPVSAAQSVSSASQASLGGGGAHIGHSSFLDLQMYQQVALLNQAGYHQAGGAGEHAGYANLTSHVAPSQFALGTGSPSSAAAQLALMQQLSNSQHLAGNQSP